MPNAYCLIKPDPFYRRDAFAGGLQAAGYTVKHEEPSSMRPGDVLLIWNRYGAAEYPARMAVAAGAHLLVAENGYIGKGGLSPHSMAIRDPYALALGYHNDSTVVREGGPERWDALGVTLQPWRARGEHVLICPNRPFGVPGRSMPPTWANEAARQLAGLTKRPIRIRAHPGNNAPRVPLADDLADCHAVVIWGSSAGVHALIAGVPVICCAPYWICKGAAGTLADIEEPPMPDRLPALRRLAWSQFSLSEITDGIPFWHLLS